MKYKIYRHVCKNNLGYLIDKNEKIDEFESDDLNKGIRLKVKEKFDAGDYLVIVPEKVKKNVTREAAKEIFEEMFLTGKRAPEIAKERNLWMITDIVEMEKTVDKVILENKKSFNEARNENVKAFNFLIGKIILESGKRISSDNAKVILGNKLNETI